MGFGGKKNNLIKSKMISETIINRTIEILKLNTKLDVLTATKQAIQEEQALISEIIDHTTERSRKLLNQMRNNVYAHIHLKNAM